MTIANHLLNNPVTCLILRLVVGIIFSFSGITKILGHSQFITIAINYNIIPENLATIYATILPWIEFIIGGYLILGIFTKFCAIISILIGVSFLVANLNVVVNDGNYCGHCFGETLTIPISASLAIDCLIILVALYLLLTKTRIHSYTLKNWIVKERIKRPRVL